MLAEPRRGLGRHELASGDVCRGGCPLESLDLGALGFRDVARRICYHIWPLDQPPEHIRDLLLVMPLFWSGMDMFEPVD